ncbi:hypothetical protein HF313_21790 [Massilia atriviolacea]|uniref:Uncharacterized protein n=1 Tax=Massilia atriviolacea TaxID=2495579 RepID=A0A430HFC2_9BURK|nr:hypothetical protein [Massilia atriviolacea]RSZ56206.1 hypothetical protein EJB06_25225 [Massilia atriviolacea]
MLTMLAVLYAGLHSAQAADRQGLMPLHHGTIAKDHMQQPEKKILLDLKTFRSGRDVKALSRAIREMSSIENAIPALTPPTPAKDKFSLWLIIFDAIDSELAPNDDDTKQASLNVVPPLATGLPPGVSPEAIKDPALRAEYEAALAANDARNRRLSYQHRLRTEEQFAEDSLLDLVRVASQPELADLRSRVAQSPLQAQRKIRLTELLTPTR